MTLKLLQADLTTSGDGHYDPKNDVLLRLEALTSNETRVSPLLIGVLLLFDRIRVLHDTKLVSILPEEESQSGALSSMRRKLSTILYLDKLCWWLSCSWKSNGLFGAYTYCVRGWHWYTSNRQAASLNNLSSLHVISKRLKECVCCAACFMHDTIITRKLYFIVRSAAESKSDALALVACGNCGSHIWDCWQSHRRE